MRRCPCSTVTMPTIIPIAITRMIRNWNVPDCSIRFAPWNGRRETTDAKIRTDMPLPMPRWVISSASHMTSAVPAVHVRTMSAAFHGVKSGISTRPVGRLRPSGLNPPLPRFSANTNAVDCTIASATVR